MHAPLQTEAERECLQDVGLLSKDKRTKLPWYGTIRTAEFHVWSFTRWRAHRLGMKDRMLYFLVLLSHFQKLLAVQQRNVISSKCARDLIVVSHVRSLPPGWQLGS